MQAGVSEKLAMQSSLRGAWDRDELEDHYQPIVQIDNLATTHVEALLRWRQPGADLALPSVFLDIAEKTGLIVPMGEWVLTRSAFDCADWQDRWPGVGVAVNLSARQFEL